MSKPQRGDDGLYPTFAWPGGYPLYYVDRAGFTMCPDCVNGRDEEAGEPEDVDINWENDSLYCDDCGDRIESAYGEPDESGEGEGEGEGEPEEEEEPSEPEIDDSDPYQYGPEDTSNEPDPYGFELYHPYNDDDY